MGSSPYGGFGRDVEIVLSTLLQHVGPPRPELVDMAKLQAAMNKYALTNFFSEYLPIDFSSFEVCAEVCVCVNEYVNVLTVMLG